MPRSALMRLIAASGIALLLAACGGGGGGTPQPANVAPTANAGAVQTVTAGATVVLNGSASSDSDGSIAAYSWTQTAGTAVTLSSTAAAQPSFAAPAVTVATVLTFSLVVTDNRGAASAASTVSITVNPAVVTVQITGLVRFSRVSNRTTSPFGLDYSAPVLRPARGVIVRAVDPANPATVLATGVSDAAGNYALTVAPNISVAIQVVAQLQRDASQPLPRWDVRVQNGTTGNTPYSHTTAAFNSSAGAQNIDIPTGISASGTATGTRASGPFAILDTIYTAVQKLLTVAPTANFPQLVVDWGVQTDGTHFMAPLNGPQSIALLADLTDDTDEFDQHVVAHEFGHYIEHNFSRADNIGGSHAFGDKLDMRVAFGEGFGYAFAAIMLDDPIVRDSYVGLTGNQQSSTFSVETNPSGSSGCWCSESSVASILWDLYDSVPDGSDNITLPLSGIWEVLVNAERTTPAMTSIFSFITALKISQPASAAAINALVAAQNINVTTIDAFATTETNTPYAGLLPLYPVITRGGGAVVVRNMGNSANLFNKAGNHSFLRITPTTTGEVTISLTTSNGAVDRDPDFIVWSSGLFWWQGADDEFEYPEVERVPMTAGRTYIIDVYDCANGCSTPSGTPGDYNLTVTIN